MCTSLLREKALCVFKEKCLGAFFVPEEAFCESPHKIQVLTCTSFFSLAVVAQQNVKT